jgi:hypothetical protein
VLTWPWLLCCFVRATLAKLNSLFVTKLTEKKYMMRQKVKHFLLASSEGHKFNAIKIENLEYDFI